MEYGPSIVTGIIALVGWAATWGTMRRAVNEHDKRLEANDTEHGKLHERITLGLTQMADSVAEHYVRKDYCELMHSKIPPNGSASRERP